MPDKMQVRLTLEYDGADFCGWQLQPGQDSIQGRLEAALERIFNCAVRVRGAGRTDAGVHATGQVAAIRLPRPFDPGDLKRALNALLPPTIVVLDAASADDNFNPRRDASSRLYEYRILNRAQPSAFDYRHVWLVRGKLDLDAMNDAASRIIGEHDFSAFRSLGSEERTTRRIVLSSRWNQNDVRIFYRIEANSFMRHMVRTLVGAMVEIGRGRASADSMTTMLEKCDRALVPASAPSSGLFLIAVRYPG
ncbi:MAG: tRNA pseudouridine(38-40) synthase TruA [Candidatus Binataceae bacterium]